MIQECKKAIEATFAVNCAQVIEMIKGLPLADVKIEEESLKNFVIDLYDLEVAQKRVAGIFIKEVSSATIYFGDKFVKFLPSGLAWIGGYGKMEVISNVMVDNPILKTGIWFVLDEETNTVTPIYPERNASNQYERLQSHQLEVLFREIFA